MKVTLFQRPASNPSDVRAVFAIMTTGVAISALLRLLQLGRLAPYGEPFVEKLEWYFFHAIAYDALWTLPFFIPLLTFFWFYPKKHPGTAHRPWLKWVLFAQALLLCFNGVDHEMMRFLAVHGGLSQFRTYIGPDAILDLPDLLSKDAGGVGVPVFTVLGSGLMALALGPQVIRRFERKQVSLRRCVITLLVFLLLSYALLFHIWKGGFRLLKLRPVLATIAMELNESVSRELMNPEDRANAIADSQTLWQSRSTTNWVYPSEQAPLFRVPLTDFCQTSGEDPRCSEDLDGDGVTKREDCDDTAPHIHPGSQDIPGNGVDENCDGIDAKPWNVVVIFLESHRAINVGHLKPFGAVEASTPFMDSLALNSDSRSFTRYQVNGVPTIEAFMNAHCSMYSKSWGHSATDDTRTRMRCLPQILRDKGFYTRFFTGAAPDWDNQSYWLSKWYHDTDFSRDRQTDLSLFRYMGQWMKDNLNAEEPFFIGAITKSNHFPFNPIEDMTPEEKAKTPDNMDTTMRYTDRSLKEFFEAIQDEPWYPQTVFLLTADHGFNWGEKGYYRLGAPLYRPSTWIPLVVVGAHPELKPIPQMDPTLSSHVDLAPTVLDLLGIQEACAFVGHSLLDDRFRERPYVFASHGKEIAWETPEERLLLAHQDREREHGEERFIPEDFSMDNPGKVLEQHEEIRRWVHGIQGLTDETFTKDTVLPSMESK